MKTNKVLACSRKAQLSFEMLLGQISFEMPTGVYCLKCSFKNTEIHPVLGLFLRFLLGILVGMKKSEFQICFGAQNLNEEQR